MNSLFSPAVTLLNRLTYPRKFGLIGLLFALPLGLVTFFLVSEFSDRIAFSEKEKLGNEYLRPVQQFASDLRDHRGLTWAFVDQEHTPAKLRRVDQRLQCDIQEIDAVDLFSAAMTDRVDPPAEVTGAKTKSSTPPYV